MPPRPIGKAVRLAESFSGLPYIFGHEESAADPTPEAFDCSEMVEYIDDKLGLGAMPDGSMNQLAFCQAKGTMLPSVEAGLKTRGALLFRHISVLGVGHVAISRGTNPPTSVEARGSAYGCGVFTAAPSARLWTHAALWPGFDYDTTDPVKLVERWVVLGPYGGRWGHVNVDNPNDETARKLFRHVKEFNRKFPHRPALVLKRREPKDLDEIDPNDFPKWLAKKASMKGGG